MRKISRVARVYGRLLVLREVDGGWDCQCGCGNVVTVADSDIWSEGNKPCRCSSINVPRKPEAKKTTQRKPLQTHGMSKTPEYKTWQSIKERCYNTNHKHWLYYGGRGITMCSRWRDSFLAFLNDMGKRPGPEYSIDRIDGDESYFPENCRWATPVQQANNRKKRRVWYYEI